MQIVSTVEEVRKQVKKWKRRRTFRWSCSDNGLSS